MPAQPSPPTGPSGRRARVGFMPNRPHDDAGMRTEPPPSLPCAIGTIPPATAAPDPPDEPPATRSRSQGLRVGLPYTVASVVGPIAQLGAGGPPERHQPRPTKAHEHLAVERRPVRSRTAREPCVHGWSIASQPEVLHQERHAGERPHGQPALDRCDGGVVLHRCDRADRRVDRLGRGHRRVEQLAWRHLAPAHQFGQGHSIEVGQTIHRRSLADRLAVRRATPVRPACRSTRACRG